MLSEIKRLNLKHSLTYYGIKLNSHDKAKCPIHKEKNPSMKIYTDRWVCFGCGKSGDIVDFVKEYFGLDFQAACKKICEDFGIGDIKLSYKDKRRIKKEQEARERAALIAKQQEEKYWETWREFAEWDKLCINYKPAKMEEVGYVWIMANKQREILWDKIQGME